MNAITRPADVTIHRFTVEDMYAMFRAGVTPDDVDLELADGFIVQRGRACLHRFTVANVYDMMRAGVIPEGAQVELIEGLLIEMPADGPQHRQFTNDLAFWLYSILDQRKYTVLPNTTLVLSEDSAPSPDWSITPADIPMDAVRGSDSLLVIEQADSSLTRDLQSKAALYAAHGVRDYWVIDINAKTLHIHRDPTPEGYGFKQRFAADAGVEALLIPGLTLRLDALSRVG